MSQPAVRKQAKRAVLLQHSTTRSGVLQLLSLVFLLGLLGIICFRIKTSVLDLDLWWHLKTGAWIAHHRVLPYADSFSRTAAGHPWLAYSWIPELLLWLSFRSLGLLGIGLYGVCLTLAVACSVFWMAWRLSGNFLLACILTSSACYAFLFNTMPRPVFFSMGLLSVTLTLLLLANRTGQVRMLYWLPPLFWFWANCHIQFVYGIAVLGLLLATTIAEQILGHFGLLPSWWSPSRLPVRTLLVLFAACVAATLLIPYSFHVYQEAYGYSKAKVIYTLVTELQPLDFLSPRHFVQLLLTAAAFFVAGWNRKIDVFKLALLGMCSVVAYRAIRESWFICIPAVACLSDLPGGREDDKRTRPELTKLAYAFLTVLIALVLFRHALGFDQAALLEAVSAEFPVRAADSVREQNLPGPLYNTLRWGGFLTWYLPEYPVAIDGRTDLYGDETVERFTKTAWAVSYATDPYLAESRVVLLQKGVPLSKFLASDPNFELVYEDRISAVYRRR